MSSLRALEKRKLEKLFAMESGYVMDFSNRGFSEFISDAVGIDIYNNRYVFKGESKANRLRALWEIESDQLVGRLLIQLIEYARFLNSDSNVERDKLAKECKGFAERLLGETLRSQETEEDFLRKDLEDVSLAKAVRDPSLLRILELRFAEASKCVEIGTPLAAILLCGSILEGLLLDAASSDPFGFKKASNCPKDKNGMIKKLEDWRLSELIDVAFTVGSLSLDVKKFSHVLRDFRNYIHPRSQLVSDFNPDNHTARICLQVLKAAIADISGERK